MAPLAKKPRLEALDSASASGQDAANAAASGAQDTANVAASGAQDAANVAGRCAHDTRGTKASSVPHKHVGPIPHSPPVEASPRTSLLIPGTPIEVPPIGQRFTFGVPPGINEETWLAMPFTPPSTPPLALPQTPRFPGDLPRNPDGSTSTPIPYTVTYPQVPSTPGEFCKAQAVARSRSRIAAMEKQHNPTTP